ncbi:MAG: hypothetical protein HQL06_11565, partial [Nitrospirae bacterium]|nr:hypothetical protein [Nitrospirota bacterium]
YEYDLIDMRDIDCDMFLYSERPQEMVFSILCNFQDKGVTIYLKELLSRIKDFVREETLRGKYIRQIEVMSQLRSIQKEVSKEVEDMALIFDIEQDIRFKQGLEKGLLDGLEKGMLQGLAKGMVRGREEGLLEGQEKGLLEGQEKGLLEGIELALDIKFGSQGLALMERIKGVDNISSLKKIKEHIRRAATVTELSDLISSY